MEHCNKELEHRFETTKEKEQADRRLLLLEIFVGAAAILVLFALIAVADFVPMADGLRIFLTLVGLVLFVAACSYALRIEQVAGYYQCAKCGHRYVPTYKSVLWAAHIGRTRYMRCPKCNQTSWQKKVLSKE